MRDVRLAGTGPELAGRWWECVASRGTLVVAHGLGEHSGSFADLAESLIARPKLVDVLAFDQRGHGRSPGARGRVARYDDLVEDLVAAVAWARGRRPGAPVFVLGHSNGGLVALRAILSGRLNNLRGLVLSNPALGLAIEPPAWKLAIGHLLRVTRPGWTLPVGIDQRQLVSDPQLIAAREADSLRHERISAALYFGIRSAMSWVQEHAATLRLPVLAIVSPTDPITDAQATLRFLEGVATPKPELILCPGALHEPLHDSGSEPLRERLADWIERRLAGEGSGPYEAVAG